MTNVDCSVNFRAHSGGIRPVADDYDSAPASHKAIGPDLGSLAQ